MKDDYCNHFLLPHLYLVLVPCTCTLYLTCIFGRMYSSTNYFQLVCIVMEKGCEPRSCQLKCLYNIFPHLHSYLCMSSMCLPADTPHFFYSGLVCQFDNKCASNPCKGSGTCAPDAFGNAVCTCPRGWTGKYCDIDIDECATAGSSMCAHGGTCRNTNGSHACDCIPGFTGEYILYSTCHGYDRCGGSVVRASTSQSGGRGFDPSHTEDFKNWYLLPSCQALGI